MRSHLSTEFVTCVIAAVQWDHCLFQLNMKDFYAVMPHILFIITFIYFSIQIFSKRQAVTIDLSPCISPEITHHL